MLIVRGIGIGGKNQDFRRVPGLRATHDLGQSGSDLPTM
jgi:hypothetical protein